MGEKLKAFSLSWATRQGCPLLPVLFSMVLEVLAIAIRQEKEIKILIEKKKCHCLQMAWYQTEKILHITKKLTSKLSEATGYRIYTQKSVACLCINNELSERESKKIIMFKISPKRIKYLG